MTKVMDVGRNSQRTPGKHKALLYIVQKVFFAAAMLGAERIVSYELCAGDGEGDFWNSTSPGIVIGQAAEVIGTKDLGEALVLLYERKSSTYAKLITNLSKHLGQPELTDGGAMKFEYRGVVVIAYREDGRNARVDFLRKKDCVFVFNDPNSIQGWAMRSTMAAEVRKQGAWMLTTFSAIGFNACGDKAWVPREIREETWRGHLQAVKDNLSGHQDLILAAIRNEAEQWAYAVTPPKIWRNEIESLLRKAFREEVGREMDVSWWRVNQDGFIDMEDSLILTKKERTDREEGLFTMEELG